MRRAAVFCTARLDSCPARYQAWVDYYTEFFRGLPVDLHMVNDGPDPGTVDLKGVELHCFSDALGRQDLWVFPGWKRSYYCGLGRLSKTHEAVGHVESDCYVLPQGKDEYVRRLMGGGFWCGWCPNYQFPETALQVVNDERVRQALLTRYADHTNWYEPLCFERDVVARLKPGRMLSGRRVYGSVEHAPKGLTYLAQALPRNVREYEP